MAQPHTLQAYWASYMHRVHARRVARAKPATAFVSAPEPRTIGIFARGRQLVAGNFLFSGVLTEAPGVSIWDIPGDNLTVADEVQGFGWLDDLAAVGDDKARKRAQAWVFEWISRHGDGRGPGWTPDLAGRRLIRWINHGFFLLRGQKKDATDQFFQSLARQTIFLARRWKSIEPGLPRFEALAGMVYAGLALEGMDKYVDQAVAALARDCETQIDSGGGIKTRNPEELLEVFTLLTWTSQALQETDREPPVTLTEAIERIAPTLRGLRDANGGLARFHGGGRGLDGRLDQALASSGVRTPAGDGMHMGFARLTAGRTSLIIDAAKPPTGPASSDAHASTLAFELTSGRRPVIVNCGSGHSFGEEWRRAGRATPSHTTLGIDGYSSSRLGETGRIVKHQERLIDGPTLVRCDINPLDDGRRIEMSHDGYQVTHGLTHARTIDFANDGRGLAGEDVIATLDAANKAQFMRALDASGPLGIPFSIRFHLHPEVHPILGLGGAAVSLTLKSKETWVFRHDMGAAVTLAPSVYLENGRLKPRPTQQVVLSGHTMAYATRVRWSLAKTQDTPEGVRDLVQADPMDSFED